MATLSIDKPRKLAMDSCPLYTAHKVIATDIIYEGALVGESSSTGNARPLAAGDTFLGLCVAKADNSAGAAADIEVICLQRGVLKSVPVTGVSTQASVGDAVYASDDDVLTLTSTNSSPIGKIIRWDVSTKCDVYFEAAAVRSI